jgi:hypothetical protein
MLKRRAEQVHQCTVWGGVRTYIRRRGTAGVRPNATSTVAIRNVGLTSTLAVR